MRWMSKSGRLALLLAAATGCTRQCYITCDTAVMSSNLAQAGMELSPQLSVQETIEATKPPPTILDPERKIRYMPLAECIAIALEQGTVGNQTAALSNLQSGTANVAGIPTSSDQTVSFSGGRSVGSSDAIRVLALDPASVGVGIENSLSKFDAVWTTSASWQNTDTPIGNSLSTFQAQGSNVVATQQQVASVSTGLLKPLATGGTASITFNDTYTYTNLPARVNPSYQPSLQFGFEQPLLQGYGTEINQLRASHPGEVLLNNGVGITNPSPTAEGILITRIRFDQQRAEFQRNVINMLINVEIAYWNLYNSYWQLYSQEAGMRQAYEAYRISKASYEAGRAKISDLAQTRGQYETFRGNRLNALSDVQENERQLRAMLGMHIEDGTRLVPSDNPTLAPYSPNWETAIKEALALRPELYLARQDVKANQLNVILQENSLLPDLRFGATYDINSIGTRLDGTGDTNALKNLSGDHFNNWGLQLRLNVPLGFRSANANLRQARLQLARSYETLHDQELKIERFLALQYRRIFSSYELIVIRRAQREAFAIQLQARFQEFAAGRIVADLLLEAQRAWASALADEYTAIRDYNNVLAGFEFAKGTIIQHDNVIISEGGLPQMAQKRATEHLQERSKALVLRERAVPTTGQSLDLTNEVPMGPIGGKAPALTDIANVPKPEPLPLVGPLPKELAPAAGSMATDPKAATPTPILSPTTSATPSTSLKPAPLPTQLNADHASDFGALRPPDVLLSDGKTSMSLPPLPSPVVIPPPVR